ncbi:MAG TPA: Trm112 family protein, partial [Gaiellaceae bacterium]|nr:Trm112 family protein [Gaiellaceae bacterium]
MTPPRLLDLLACPRCAAPLEPSDDMLRCRGCGSAFPVLDGIPRLAPGEVAAGQAETAERFGAQWRHFDELHPEFEEEFLGWVTP